MKIYINHNTFKCHTTNPDGTFLEAETDFFDGKCRQYIEGYRFVPSGESWVREDGEVFTGEMVAPWRPYEILTEFQALYEEEQEKQAEAQEALAILLEGDSV